MSRRNEILRCTAILIATAFLVTGCGAKRSELGKDTTPQTSELVVVVTETPQTDVPEVQSEEKQSETAAASPAATETTAQVPVPEASAVPAPAVENASEAAPAAEAAPAPETTPASEAAPTPETAPAAEAAPTPETAPAAEAVPTPETTAPETTAPVTPGTADEERASQTGYEAAKTMWAMDDVNVRSSPTTSEDNIFDSLVQGQQIQVVGETPTWYVVSVSYTNEDGSSGESQGYVSKSWLSGGEVAQKTPEEREAAIAAELGVASPEATAPAEAAPAPAEAAPVPAGNTITIASAANIRANASPMGDVVGTVEAGTVVSVIGEADGWYQIDYNGLQGYVNKNLVG